MDEKAFWIAFRAALLGIIDAIERRYCLGKHGKPQPVQPSATDTVTTPPVYNQQ